jgi:mannose-1-phosphate guanylyltransferase
VTLQDRVDRSQSFTLDSAASRGVETRGETWAVVLAGGEGSRLRTLTTTASGIAVPKQFCSLRGGASLLDEALQRATAVAPVQRICAVVAEHHARWWCRSLAGLEPANVFVQPQNRGTALGILFALLHILERDPHAVITILPADHHVGEEHVLAASLQRAVAAVQTRPADIVLLGITPEEADPELGYIVPAADAVGAPRRVARFVEKPTVGEAEALIARGALWNVFIVAARAATLLELFNRHDRGLARRMRSAVRRAVFGATTTALAELYVHLDNVDFSRDIAERYNTAFRVLPVPACAWTDLGTVQRVTKTLLTQAALAERPKSVRSTAWLSLEQQHLATRAGRPQAAGAA